MVELNGKGLKSDSGSEDDILDFTAADEHEPRGNCRWPWGGGGGLCVRLGGPCVWCVWHVTMEFVL